MCILGRFVQKENCFSEVLTRTADPGIGCKDIILAFGQITQKGKWDTFLLSNSFHLFIVCKQP